MKLKKILKKTKHRYLLIGSTNTGKTSLLHASKLEFIFKAANIYHHVQPESWWVTPKTAFLDVPGRYLANQLLKKRRPKITGLIVTVSITELLKQDQAAYHQLALEKLYQRLAELPSYITHTLPCYIIVTKCDLLPGFIEFFAESSIEEYNQVWRMTELSCSSEDLYHVFPSRFNHLLHLLNQQLIWRMHQADHVDTAAEIKDFPLQMEKIKAPLFSFTKNCMNSAVLRLQGIYFTSTFPYPHFVRQLFNIELNNNINNNFNYLYNHKFLVATTGAILAACVSAWMLTKDMRQNLNEIHFIEKSFSNYQLSIAHPALIQKRLLALNNLLNTLSQHQASPKIKKLYDRSLQTLLMPEIKNYLENYLQKSINKNLDLVYAALTAYLMLGNKDYFESTFVLHTISSILPSKITSKEKLYLMRHLQQALAQLPTENKNENKKQFFLLNISLIKETRDFLSSLTGFQLGYLILKNTNIEQIPIEKYLSTIDPKKAVFVVKASEYLPQIFTAQMFNTMFSHSAKTAAEQAIAGNWILGDDFKAEPNSEIVTGLTQQLQNIYVNHYIEKWKNLLSNFQLLPVHQLVEVDNLIANMIGTASPLLAFLKFVHDNTAFLSLYGLEKESPFLLLNTLMTEGSHSPVLQDIFAVLFSLHQTLQGVLSAKDQQKAAYDFISQNMRHNEIDIFVKVRIAANKSPAPMNAWLLEIADEAWRLLAIKANAYIDFSLHNTVKHYPLILKEGNSYVENGKNNLSRR
jgi:type VI secretion system protein ImpL